MNAMPLEQINDVSTRWLRFLPRWSLVAGLVILALPIVIFGGVGQQPSDNALGEAYAELKQAFTPLREEMARFSTRGRHVIVTGCDHTNLPVVRADAVADAVREVLAAPTR